MDAVRYLAEKGAKIEAKSDVRERGCIALYVVASCLTGLCAEEIHAAPLGSCEWKCGRYPVPGGEGRRHQCQERGA